MSNPGEYHLNIENGATIFIKPSSSASRRTKNRIREHGTHGFVICGFDPASWHFGGSAAILLKPAFEEDDWAGWVPINEIEEA